MKNGSQTDTGSQEHLDHNFIVMLAINLYLPRYTTAWATPRHGDDARGIIRRPAPDRHGRVHRAYGLWGVLDGDSLLARSTVVVPV
jgi:hypothetical protein